MSAGHSDALGFFGATGDLAYKKIFPALQAMVKRRHLDVPVIGVAKAGWGVEELRARACDSVKQHGGLDASAFDALCGRLRYVDGDSWVRQGDPALLIARDDGGGARPSRQPA
jgi:glucose-6-phosphate 1-dehydrogenase